MGYRSEVVVKFSDNAVKVVKKFYELDKQIKELIDDSERYADGHIQLQAIHWNWIKWDEEDDESIVAFMDMLDQLGEENYGMIRLGDAHDDMEHYGNTTKFHMYIERKIEW